MSSKSDGTRVASGERVHDNPPMETAPASPPTPPRWLSRPDERPRAPWWVLVSPSRSFLSLRDRPRAWLLWALVTLSASLPGVAFVRSVDLGQFIEEQIVARGKSVDDLPQEAREALRDKAPRALQVVLPVGGAAKRAALISLLAFFAFALLRGGYPQFRFTHALAAVALGAAPFVVSDLLKAAVLSVRDPQIIDVKNPIFSNPAAWFSLSTSTSAWGAMLARCDFFALWSWVLMARGIRVVSGAKTALPSILLGVSFFLLVVADGIGAAVR